MPGHGISFPDDVLRRIDAPLEFGDTRSDRVVDLVRDGLTVRDILEGRGVRWDELSPDQREKKLKALLRQGLEA